jgi:hypothetical protein
MWTEEEDSRLIDSMLHVKVTSMNIRYGLGQWMKVATRVDKPMAGAHACHARFGELASGGHPDCRASLMARAYMDKFDEKRRPYQRTLYFMQELICHVYDRRDTYDAAITMLALRQTKNG